jgi:hypothetical protein
MIIKRKIEIRGIILFKVKRVKGVKIIRSINRLKITQPFEIIEPFKPEDL